MLPLFVAQDMIERLSLPIGGGKMLNEILAQESDGESLV